MIFPSITRYMQLNPINIINPQLESPMDITYFIVVSLELEIFNLVECQSILTREMSYLINSWNSIQYAVKPDQETLFALCNLKFISLLNRL